jgi:hypothetical protein
MEVGLFFHSLQPGDSIPGLFSGLPGRFSTGSGDIRERYKVYGIGCKVKGHSA